MDDIPNYIKDRVDSQIYWFSYKARDYRRKIHTIQIITIIISSVLPIVNIIDFLPLSTRLISSVLGSIIAISTSISQQQKYEENWYNYSRVLSDLRKEKYLFIQDAGSYSDIEEKLKNKIFVERIENFLSLEGISDNKKGDNNKK